jgi:hypothetical protein
VVILVALGIVFFWGRSRREDRQQAFCRAVYRGDIQSVLGQLSPALRPRVDRSVLRAWLEHVSQVRSESGNADPPLDLDLGPGGVRNFHISDPQHRWTPRPADPSHYETEARVALREVLDGHYDAVWLRLSPLSPLRRDRRELPGHFTAIMGAVLTDPDRQAPTRSLLREGRYHLQFLHRVVDRTGQTLVVRVEYVFAGWQGRLYSISFAPA